MFEDVLVIYYLFYLQAKKTFQCNQLDPSKCIIVCFSPALERKKYYSFTYLINNVRQHA